MGTWWGVRDGGSLWGLKLEEGTGEMRSEGGIGDGVLLMVRTGASAFWRPPKGKHKDHPSSLQRGAQLADTWPKVG